MSRQPNVHRNVGNGSSSLNAPPPHFSQRSGSSGTTATSSAAAASRAERFEDEKRRIIESCFSKTDPSSGQLSESYITHIRITEDGAYPSSPPPPDSSVETKKPRLVIIAVRSTGRVRMHKARENNNGSFSIGKTWNLEELSAIESYSSSSVPPQSESEAQNRQWAGATGFTVTITKPYYWQAGTPKEKDFFIASAIKIYNKYTKGQVPELIGFDEREKASILGPLQPQGQRPPQPGFRIPSENGRSSPAPPQPSYSDRDPNGSRHGTPGPPANLSMQNRGPSGSPARFNGHGHPPPSPGGTRTFASQEQMRSQSREGFRPEFRPGTSPIPAPGYTRSPQLPNQTPSERSSHSQLRSGSPAISNVSSERDHVPKALRPLSPPRQQGSYQPSPIAEAQKLETAPLPQQTSVNGANMFNATRQRWMNQPQQEPPAQTQVPQPSAPQSPLTETTQAIQPTASQHEVESARSAISLESSIDADLGDAAAIGALTAYWGPEMTPASPPPPVIQELVGPPTPERSKKRPLLDHKESETVPDLHPKPLMGRSSAPRAEPSRNGTPVDPASRQEPGQVQPLAVASKPAPSASEPNLPIPGASSPPAVDTSPAETADDVPKAESTEEKSLRDADDSYRPGLGPMIRKNNARNKFRAAANAAAAFKPRPGGAAAQILKAKAQREGKAEPDGITAVVPRPSRQDTTESVPKVDESPAQDSAATLNDAQPPKSPIKETPKVQISSPLSPAREIEMPNLDGANGVQLTDEPGPNLKTPQQEDFQLQQDTEEEERPEQREIRKPAVKVKRRSGIQDKYLVELGIDRALLENKCLEFEATLTDHGWSANILQPKHLADIETGLKREQGRIEAGSWLSQTDASTRDEKVVHVEALLDRAIQECDELEGLLTLYNVELGSLNEDIAYIEAQSQGLQVQSANQKLLQSELQGLVDTISLDRRVLEPLRHGDLGNLQGLDDVEHSLIRLYQALVTIDPNVRLPSNGRPRSKGGLSDGGSDLASMKALREKRDVYGRESNAFCQRLLQHLDSSFMLSMNDAKSRVTRTASSGAGAGTVRLHKEVFTEAKRGLWVFSPLLLYMKEVNPPAWQTVLRMYWTRTQPLYADGFRLNIASWKRSARKPGSEDADMLFTTQEKEDAAPVSGGGIAGNSLAAARKLTVKRSQTLAKSLRNASGGNKHSPTETRASGMSLMSSEIFAGLMDDMAPLVSQEQNFLVDMFHVTSLATADFLDAVTANPPDHRRGTNLLDRKPIDPDREMAKRMQSAMEEIFTSCFSSDMGVLLDWSVSSDPLQGVGVMASLSKHAYYLQDTNQEFILQLVETLITRLRGLWNKFVEEQVRAIEETKVKIKKRKGVIAFMKVFPHFSAAVENIFSAVAGIDYEGPAECVFDVRQLVDDAYSRLNRAMFDSLKVIAKESPGANASTAQGQKGGTDDSEDKEMLNYHILLIENMNHYIEEVDDGGKEGVLAEWRGRAMLERMEALEAYIGRVLRRPLGKLLDFLDSTDSLLASHPTNPQSIAARPSYSRKVVRNMLAQYDPKEVRRGIETLRKRIEKHFGEGGEEQLSRGLVGFVCKECEREYEKVLERMERVIREIYPVVEGEKAVEIPFEKGDLVAGVRR